MRERLSSSGDVKWSVLRTAFAIGAIAAMAGWFAAHSHSGGDPGGAGRGGAMPYAVSTEDWPTASGAQSAQPPNQSAPRSQEAVSAERGNDDASGEPAISVYLADKKKIETVPLETYVLGVVAAEMPLDFEPAALQAQALAARTYVVRRLLAGNRDGVPGGRALVTDQATHQVYRSLADIKRLQAADPEGIRKAKEAVEQTRDQILTYDGRPIEALFFSSSNGNTENSEDVFSNKLPYLRAVPSPWDTNGSHRSEETVTMPLAVFYEKLGVSVEASAGLGRPDKLPAVRLMGRTEGRRVKTLLVGSESFSGAEARDKLGLRSAAFDWRIANGEIQITTVGYGHGVGMSQWGAQGMAKEGSGARQIVEHYYTGVRIAEASKLLEQSGIEAKL